MTTPRPVLVVTVCRRYHELAKNLPRALDLAESELGFRPDVIVVWARPELPRLRFMQALVASKQAARVVGRPAVPGEGGATTYPESLSLRMGLEHARRDYPGHYAVVMTADVCPHPGTLSFIQEKMAGHHAVVFHWDNGCARERVWHTNFFACSLDEAYWPPVSRPDDQGSLESQYGAALDGRPLVFRSHNSGGRRFSHRHESEGLPPFPEEGLPASRAAPLYCEGSPSAWGWACRLFSALSFLPRSVFRVISYPFTEQPWQSALTKTKKASS